MKCISVPRHFRIKTSSNIDNFSVLLIKYKRNSVAVKFHVGTRFVELVDRERDLLTLNL
jgi:hypothetical protein